MGILPRDEHENMLSRSSGNDTRQSTYFDHNDSGAVQCTFHLAMTLLWCIIFVYGGDFQRVFNFLPPIVLESERDVESGIWRAEHPV